MSLVIGYADDHTVWMAGDGRVTLGCEYRAGQKVRPYCDGTLLVGTTGSHRLNNVVLDDCAPTFALDGNGDAYDCALSFAEVLRQRCKAVGVVTNKDGREEMEGRVLLGYDGRVVLISPDFAVVEGAPWAAIGCGCEWAEGALATLDRLQSRLVPEDKLRLVLELVAERDIHVGPPYSVLRTAKR